MNTAVHNKLVSFIWAIADDCLRDVYVRGKYRDVILPMVVLRRLDALLEPTKDKVMKDGMGVPYLSQSDINNFSVPLPSFEEQKQIANHIETQSSKIDKAISLQERQIEKLKEYKATLIDSAVTGKIKVC